MFHIFTIGSDESKMTQLKESAEISMTKINYIVTGSWNGYVDKIITMMNLLKDIPDDDIVCFIDAYDVLSFSGQAEILSKFKEYNCKLVLSGELTCYPDKYQGRYNEIYAIKTDYIPPSNFKYVNSGGYIGYKKAIMELLLWKPLEEIHIICEKGGDQNYFSEYYLEYGLDNDKGLKIDVGQQLFQSMNKTEFGDFEFINGRLHNKILNNFPCFAHFNGFNMYNMQIVNLHSFVKEQCCEVFLNKVKASIVSGYESLHYSVPFFITIGGVLQENIPQK